MEKSAKDSNFLIIVVQCLLLINSEAIKFYINEQPHLLNDMLKVIAPKLDLSNTIYVRLIGIYKNLLMG